MNHYKDGLNRINGVSRREFFRDVVLPASAALAAGGVLAGCGADTGSGAGFVTDKRTTGTAVTDMVIVRNGEPEELVRQALQKLGGMQRFIARGDVVLLKPNIGFNRMPQQAANTNPDVVREIARQVLDAGARKVIVFDHTLYEARNCYNRSGIARAVQDLGVELEYAEERKFVDVDVNGQFLKTWPFYREVLAADKVINIPVAKQHSLAQYSMGMKNMMGVIGGRRDSLHQNMDMALPDISRFLRPTLTVLDAYRILLRNGPQGGSLNDVATVKTLAAGIDPVAVDAFGCSLFDVDPARIGYIRTGQEVSLGTMNWQGLRLEEVSL
ncbi:MAG: DUF362 domain-containing protein [Acidobacteria bacterium]|nr:DUF362 domain-containing protein [Acidobacteriota bacterium]